VSKSIPFFFLTFFSLFLFLKGQESDYKPGELIVQLQKGVRAEAVAKQLSSMELQPKRQLSRRLNIWLFSWEQQKASDETALDRVWQNENVIVAQFNHYVTQRSTFPNDPQFGSQWALNNTGQGGGTPDADIDAPEAWNFVTGGTTVTGDEIIVAVIDGGFDLTHQDLSYWMNHQEIPANGIDDDHNGYVDDFRGWNAYNHNGNIPNDPHGTHVAGIAAAKGNNNTGISGVNWGTKIMPIAGSSGTESVVVEAYGYALEMRARYNETSGDSGAFVVVTNSSFGVDYGNPANFPIWCAMYDSLGACGILSCAATANRNIDVDVLGDIPTACPSDFMISVTNTTRNDVKNPGAAYGATAIDLGAPGSSILSTLPGNSYGSMSGTSMATPHVAGAVALLWAAAGRQLIQEYSTNPAEAALLVKDFILNGTDSLPDLRGITVSGGRLNLMNSVLLVRGYPNANPQIRVIPTSISDTLFMGAAGQREFYIYNDQTQPGSLDFAIHVDSSVSWLAAVPLTGSVGPSSFQTILVNMNTLGLRPGMYVTELIVTGNDTLNPADTVSVALQVREYPPIILLDTLNFNLPVNSVDSQAVAFRNYRDSSLVFQITDEEIPIPLKEKVNGNWDQSIEPIPEDCPWVSENPDSGLILAGDSMEVWIVVDATGLFTGDYLAQIVVHSDDPVHPVVNGPVVWLHAYSDPGTNFTYPDVLDFDTTFVGTSSQRNLTLLNAGTDTLRVYDITCTNPQFIVDTTSFYVLPFDSMVVPVRFSSMTTGNFDCWVVVESNFPGTPLDSTLARAFAIEPPHAMFTPGFTNPIPVWDSVDVSVNIANTGGSDLLWNAFIDTVPATRKIILPVHGPMEAPKNAEVAPRGAGAWTGTIFQKHWNLQFSADLTFVTGALGNAGSEFDGTYYYTTRWASNLLHKIDQSGNLVEEFSIPGVSGLRDLAFDGTYMYGGTASTTIYIMDFSNKTVVGTISSPQVVRHIAYDENADGFWVGDWASDIVLVGRSGATLATIPRASHGLERMYGSAYDNVNCGPPCLWVFDQGSGSGAPQLIHQIDLTNHTLTGFSYDVASDFPFNGIAGGLFSATDIVPGTFSIGGVLQGTTDMLFVYGLVVLPPNWLRLIVDSGSVAPSQNMDIPLRIYGSSVRIDSAYVVFHTNDPLSSVINIWVVRDVLTEISHEVAIPTTYAVSQNYPNPFNPATTIKFQLPEASSVTLVIYNTIGQVVRRLVDTKMGAGYHEMTWDGLNDSGMPVSSGIYIYRFKAGDYRKVRKMIFMK